MNDPLGVEMALKEHFRLLDQEPLPVNWTASLRSGYYRVCGIARNAGKEALENMSIDASSAQTQELTERAAVEAASSAKWRCAWTKYWVGSQRDYGNLNSSVLANGSISNGESYSRLEWRLQNRLLELAEHSVWGPLESWVANAASRSVWSAQAFALMSILRGPDCPSNGYSDVFSPFLRAFEAGLWLFWVCEKEVVAVPRPVLRIVDGQLHADGDVAVSWPGGESHCFLHGVRVPAKLVLETQSLTVDDIERECNIEARRLMIQRYGFARFLLDSGGEIVHHDRWGTLYRRQLPGDEPLAMVRVTNSTPGPDDQFKDYFLQVPPTMRTAKEAIAWTFGMRARDYRPLVET